MDLAPASPALKEPHGFQTSVSALTVNFKVNAATLVGAGSSIHSQNSGSSIPSRDN